MEHRFYKLEIFVPEDYFAAVRQALWSVDAGHIGEYDRCLSWSRVNSCWRPLEGADLEIFIDQCQHPFRIIF